MPNIASEFDTMSTADRQTDNDILFDKITTFTTHKII